MTTPNSRLYTRVLEIERLSGDSTLNFFKLITKYNIVLLEDKDAEVWWAYFNTEGLDLEQSAGLHKFGYNGCASSSCPEEAICLVIINYDSKVRRGKIAELDMQARKAKGLVDTEGRVPYAYHQGNFLGQNID